MVNVIEELTSTEPRGKIGKEAKALLENHTLLNLTLLLVPPAGIMKSLEL